MARLTDERIQAIKAALTRDPYAHIPDRAFLQAGAFRPNLDDVPVELKRADVRALLADLKEAREHRRILREAVELMLRVRAAVSNPDLSVDAMILGDVWRQVESALAATEEKP